MDISSAAQTAARTLAGGAQPSAAAPAGLPAGVHEVQRVAAPGGGTYVVGSDGAVYALGGAAYYGGGNNIKGDTLAGQHQFGADALRLNPTGGYTLTDTAGRSYGLDTNYARANGFNVPDQGNTLYSDPAFLAFQRASGLGLETAANQVRQQTGAINAALQTNLGDLANQYNENSRRTQGGYESRGILRSSDTQQGLDQVERARSQAVSAANSGAANQISGLNQSLASQIAGQQNKAAELGLTTAQGQDYNNMISGIQRKYAPELANSGIAPTS
jgi:hypothetical protein